MQITRVQTRLLLYLLPFFLVSFAVLAGASYYLANKALSDSNNDTAAAIGNDYSNRIAAEMTIIQSQLEDLASIQRVRAGTDKLQIQEALVETSKRLGKLDTYIFISPDGSAVRSDGTTGQLGDRV